MRTKQFLSGLAVILAVWIIIPLFLILLNRFFNLPVVNNSMARFAGAIFFVVGVSGVLYFTKIHIKAGRITPVPSVESPKRFIAEGLYRYSRNPMYLTILLTFFGGFLLLGYFLLFIYFLISILALHLFVVCVEEPELQKKFGERYIEYVRKVPRWLPKIRN